MRTHYLVLYDITEPRRLQKIHKICTGFGRWIQYSVFSAELSPLELERFKRKLSPFVVGEDQVLFIRLNPVKPGEDPLEKRTEWLGRRYVPHKPESMII